MTLDGAPNGPTEHVEVGSDSVRLLAQQAGSARAVPGAWYRLRVSTPYDLALLAQYLLERAGHTASLLPNGSARAVVVADTAVRIAGSRQHLRFVAIQGLGAGDAQPDAIRKAVGASGIE